MTDSTNKSVYTPSPIDLAIPRCENEYISIQQDETSITTHGDNEWIQTGTVGTAQVLISAAHKGIFLQNSLTQGGSLNEIKIGRAGVYKAVYSAQVEFTAGTIAELGIGLSSTVGTAIVNNLPAERIVRLQTPTGQTGGLVSEHITGSMILILTDCSILRLYDRALSVASDITILNADITVQRLGRNGQ